MKDLSQSKTTQAEAVQNFDAIDINKNPKISQRLLRQYECLVAAAKGLGKVRPGADYHLSHPLGSKDRSTDVYHLGQRAVASKAKLDDDF